jgi:hypothetical protein
MPDAFNTVDNPLIWPIYTLLQQSQRSWKLNELYAELQRQGIAGQLAKDPQRQLFKVNFLLMNALYQLRELLDATQSLLISVLDIRLLNVGLEAPGNAVSQPDALRDYYLNWQNFEASSEQVDALLSSFWRDFSKQYGDLSGMARQEALLLFELDETATTSQIRQQWRRLAFRWHPDRPDGDEERFKTLCDAWQSLKS